MHLSVAIPMLDELENVPCLLQTLCDQTFSAFSVYVCVNQPDAWWSLPEDDWRKQACLNNGHTLQLLRDYTALDIRVIDCSSHCRGWTGKHTGVGWARKLLFDQISADCADGEIIVSLDADTMLSDCYLEKVFALFATNPSVSALAAPYYHPLSGNDDIDRVMLRYECYMRHYLVNLLEISNPYAFTALGSAMAFPLWAYKRVGGITPFLAGEDFYLMQKFAKTGQVLLDGVPPVSPQGRRSQRVPFGTGPALSLSMQEMEQRYPFFDQHLFGRVKETFDSFNELYENDIDTPMTSFLQQQLKTNDLWGPLRRNFKQRDLFVRSCRQRVDGLRIQQFLKNQDYPSAAVDVDFSNDGIETLATYRDSLFRQEAHLRQQRHIVGCG